MRRDSIDAKVLYKALDDVTRAWARDRTGSLDLFDPLVELGLHTVETEAKRIVASAVAWGDTPRNVTHHERQKAARQVIIYLIEGLCPDDSGLSPRVYHARTALPDHPWPNSVAVPPSLRPFLRMALPLVWHVATVDSLERLFSLSHKAVADIRQEALRQMTAVLWEREKAAGNLRT